MKRGHGRFAKVEQPVGKVKHSGSKRRMIERAKMWKPETSPKLREIYSSRIEWMQKVVPKFTKQAET